MTDRNAGNQGPATDHNNAPVVDPTKNVLDLVDAAVARIDDLRKADGHLNDELRKAESRRIDEQAALRADHAKELRESEARRLDAIRQVDVAARSTEAERQAQALEALARTTATNAETLRALVGATASTLAGQNAEINKQQLDRISELEKRSYMGAGADTGKSEGYANIKGAILFAVVVVGFLLGQLLPLLRK